MRETNRAAAAGVVGASPREGGCMGLMILVMQTEAEEDVLTNGRTFRAGNREKTSASHPRRYFSRTGDSVVSKTS